MTATTGIAMQDRGGARVRDPHARGPGLRRPPAARARRAPRELLAARGERWQRLGAGELPDFLPETREIRDGDWRVPEAPPDLHDRRVEITGPVDRKMIINALNSGANVFMADFEDANSPTWANMRRGPGQPARRGAPHDLARAAGRQAATRSTSKTATLVVRPRGWHLSRSTSLRRRRAGAGSALRLRPLLLPQRAGAARARHRPVLLPAEAGEPPRGAALERRLRPRAGASSASPRGTIKATVLIETILAAFEMDEILYELRDHSAGLNCGRWDYIFSFIKKFAQRPDFVLPDRGAGHDGQGRSCARTSQLLIKTCHRRGVHAMGGMAAQIPIKNDPAANEAALAKVRADKLREVQRRPRRHLGRASRARPDRAARSSTSTCRAPNQLDRKRDDVQRRPRADLLRVPDGRDHRGRAPPQHQRRHPVPRGLAARHRLRAALQPDGRRGDRRDLARAGLAVDPPRRAARRRPRGRRASCSRRSATRSSRRRDRRRSAPRRSLRRGARRCSTTLVDRTNFDEFLTLPAYERARLTGHGDARMTNCKSSDADREADRDRELEHDEPALGRHRARLHAPRTSCGCAARSTIEHTLAELRRASGSGSCCTRSRTSHALGALTGNQAVQQVRAGLKAIYLSGWQVAADANLAGQMYPDQSLYPVELGAARSCERINHALQRADQIEHARRRRRHATGSRRSSPTPRPASAARSTPSS